MSIASASSSTPRTLTCCSSSARTTIRSCFYPDFDHIVLLSAPRDVIVERLAARTNNPFGKSPDELAKVLADLEMFEPMMRRSATHEIDTSQPLDRVIDEILGLIE